MKTKNFLLSGILGIALSGFVLTGCHKSSTAPDTDITAAQDESNASFVSNDSKNVSDAAMQGNSGKYGPVRSIKALYSVNCTVTEDSTTNPGYHTVTINFGSTPVECKDYRWRQGIITVDWKQSAGFFFFQAYFDSASTITESFNGYKVGNSLSTMYGVAGTRTWTNEGRAVSGFQNWNFTANLVITNPNGKTATWNSNRNNTLVYEAGINGGTWFYEITGGANGTSSNGIGYTLTIRNGSPIYVTAFPWWLGGCPWIESGIVDVTRTSSTNTLSINFGNLGNCDAAAVATLNGNNYNITMW